MNNTIPHFIADKYSEGVMAGEMKAVAMFMDISGFTSMTQTLVKNGREGNEVLGAILNRIFVPVIDAIYAAGGFVSVFAGDAVSAIFSYDEKTAADISIINSVRCAFEIKKIFEASGTQKTKFGVFDLTVKIGMSCGEVEWRVVENDIRNSYYFRGAPVSACAVCEHHCAPGEIVVDGYLFAELGAKINAREKLSGYYLLESDHSRARNFKKIDTVAEISPAIIEKFTPPSIMELKVRGEFRDIVSCFISFSQEGNIYESIGGLITLSHEYGGHLCSPDFGDKAGAVLVLFGAPSGREKLFERAALFAEKIVGSMKCGDLFPVRIGLTFGTAFAGFVGSEKRCEYTALGSVVNLSARMAAGAEWGEINLDAGFYEKTGGAFGTSAPVEMKFKGFEDKIRVYKLTGANENLREESRDSEFIGRRKEFSDLLKCLEPTGKGKFGGVIYVDGTAGSGKTRFVSELKRRLAGGDYNWFHMPCDGILRKSFNPLIHFFKNYFAQSTGIDKHSFEKKLEELAEKTTDRETAGELLRTASFLGALIGLEWKNSPFENADSRARYSNTMHAIKNLVKAECLIRPTVIQIEDGHWIDPDSIAFLRSFTRNAENLPLVIISECRHNDDGSNFSFGLKEVPEKRIQINCFDPGATKLFVESIIGRTREKNIPGKTIDFIAERSAGNPFYIEQITEYLKENKLIDENFDLVPGHFEIPAGISSIIVARLDRLAGELKEAARTASVLGHVFAVNVLLAMLNGLYAVDKPGFDKCLTEGEKQLLWETLSEVKYIFKHSLIRESIYSMQLKERLRILHRLAGETIEKLHGADLSQYYSELANHFENAENFDKAKKYLCLAGDLAAKNYQNESAAAYYERLLNILSREMPLAASGNKTSVNEIAARMEEVLFKLGNIFEVTGDWDRAGKAFGEALKISTRLRDKRLVAKNYLFVGVIHSSKGEFRQAMKYLCRSMKIFESLSDHRGISKVFGHMGYIYLSVCDFTRSIECFNRKLEICRRLKDRIGVSHAIGNLGIIHFRLGKNDLAMKCYKTQLRISEKLGEKRTISAAIGNIGTVHLVKGEYDEAMKCYDRQKKIAVELGNRTSVGVAVGNIGAICFMKGGYKRSLRYFEEHLKISREIGDKYGMAISTGNIGEVYRLLKDFAKSEEYLDDAIAVKKEINALYYLCNSLFSKAELYYDMKKVAESKKFCAEALKVAQEARNEEQVFKSKIFCAKLEFEFSDNAKRKRAAIDLLKKMLSGEKNIENIALLNFELFKMHSGEADATVRKLKLSYKKSALSLYKKLFAKTPNKEFRRRIKELELSF